MSTAVHLAREAIRREDAEGNVRVACSLPPLCESYQTEGLPGEEAMRAEYERIATAGSSNVKSDDHVYCVSWTCMLIE